MTGALSPAKAETSGHQLSVFISACRKSSLWNTGSPLFAGTTTESHLLSRPQYHSANVTGLLNSDVPPSLDVAVAVNDVSAASRGVTGMNTEKAARPVASEATLASVRKISPSAPLARRLPKISIVNC